mgnify:CR=1 FL=1
MKRDYDKITQSLEQNYNALKKEQGEITIPNENDKSDEELQSDYEYSRDVYKNLIEKSNESLESLILLAQDCENPRAFEVLSQYLKNTSDMADKLLDLQEKIRKIKANDKEGSGNDSSNSKKQQNNFFIGSTDDLQRMLKDAKKDDIKDVTNSNE